MKTRSSSRFSVAFAMAVLVPVMMAEHVHAAINLELRPSFQSVLVGNTVSVDLYAVSDSAFNQTFSGVEVILNWDTTFLSLMGDDMTGSVLTVGSPRLGGDPYGFNTDLSDGDAIWIGWASFVAPASATPSGAFLATFNFMALAATSPDTLINLPTTDSPNTGGSTTSTLVASGSTPGLNVVGSLSGAVVQINVPAPGALGMLIGAVVLGSRRRRV